MTILHRTRGKITANQVADYFLALANESGESITNLKLQKLVYYAQAWYEANFNKSLFNEDFEAWVHGPVIPKLYHQYKERGSQPIIINKKIEEVKKELPEQVVKFLGEIAKVYMTESAYTLELMTHQEDPWIEARRGYEADARCQTIISKESMREYYGKRIKN